MRPRRCFNAIGCGNEGCGSVNRLSAVDVRQMNAPLRVLGCIIVGALSAAGVIVFQRYAGEPTSRMVTALVGAAAVLLTWSVTGLE